MPLHSTLPMLSSGGGRASQFTTSFKQPMTIEIPLISELPSQDKTFIGSSLPTRNSWEAFYLGLDFVINLLFKYG